MARALLLFAAFAFACGARHDASLNKTEDDAALPDVPPPPENGPKLGALANMTPVLEKPRSGARAIGYLHAGALVARSAGAVRTTKDCSGGFYAVFPRGFVCLNQGATLDLAHPTLAAMAIQPALDQALPYTYGRTERDSLLLERDAASNDGVNEVGKLPRGSGLAVVGSWSARVAGGEPERLGLLTNGRFVRAADLGAAHPSNFSGYELGEGRELPVAFVVKRGVRGWKLEGEKTQKLEQLEFHETIPLSGRFRSVNGSQYFAADAGERWVRHEDVTLVQKRSKFPDFAHDGQRWIDVSVVTGTLVLYEGTKPIFATLASVGRDRLGDTAVADAAQAVTKLGSFEVVAKHVTFLPAVAERAGERFPLYDMPWALELASGQILCGAYWHDRFGIEHGSGDILLSPTDAHRVWQWATPALAQGWHSTTSDTEKTFVVVHK